MTKVLGIFMSASDGPSVVRNTGATHRDVTVCDFAWQITAPSGARVTTVFHTWAEAAGDVTWLHWAVKYDAAGDGSDDGSSWHVLDNEGNVIVEFEALNGTFALETHGTSTSTSASIGQPGYPTLERIDLMIDMGGAGHTVDIYINGAGTPTATVTVADSGTRGKPVTMDWGQDDYDKVCWISEFYVADFDTRNTRPIKQVVDGAGNHSAWTGGFAELGDEGIVTGAKGAANGDKVSMTLTAYPGPSSPAGINRVVYKMIASKGSSGPANINPLVRIGGVDYSAGNLTLIANVPIPAYAEFLLNPDTTAAWGTAELDTMEVGLQAVT